MLLRIVNSKLAYWKAQTQSMIHVIVTCELPTPIYYLETQRTFLDVVNSVLNILGAFGEFLCPEMSIIPRAHERSITSQTES